MGRKCFSTHPTITTVGWMRSPRDERGSGDADDALTTVQDTLDAFETPTEDDVAEARDIPRGQERGGSVSRVITNLLATETHQESIDTFTAGEASPPDPAPTPRPSRALEGLALEMAMERVALEEAALGISRDELVITIAREVRIPLERLDLVDGYLTDLELEEKVRVVGELVVLRHEDDGDLLAMDLTDEEFLIRYRRRYAAQEEGGRR